MSKAQPPASAKLATPTIPVICDRCKAEGHAADGAFAGIADILDFEPVPRRPHANAWTPEHQRAFIAALALTGSLHRAAKAVGRHHFGAEQLRKAKGGKGFDKAWDAAMDIARERELGRLQDNMAGLAEASDGPGDEAPVPAIGGGGFDDWDEEHGPEEYDATQARIREKLLGARRLALKFIEPDPEMRHAWEVLVGETDWELAAKLKPQDFEPYETVNLRNLDMVLTSESGAMEGIAGPVRHQPNMTKMLRELHAYVEAQSAKTNEQSQSDT